MHPLLPLRLFLGATFAYAGVEKLSDPGFLTPGAETYIGAQLEGFSRGTPGGWLLETFALPAPEVAGVGVAVTEIAIGLLTLAGRFTRVAAAGGLGLSLVLFLTATWRTSPYFLGSDIVFAFAWLPFVLGGAEGRPALDARPRPRPGGEPVTRRTAIARALGATVAGSALLSGLAVALRGAPPPPPPPAGTRVADSAAVLPGEALAVSGALLIRDAGGRLSARSITCTHAGCDVEWRAGRIECACHGARFDPATGEPTSGPALEPLAALPVIEREGAIYLT